MYYQQKRAIASILAAVVLLAAYIIYVLGQVNAGAAAADDVKFFAVTILTFIGVAVGVNIVLQIVFHILLSVSVAVRERDKGSEAIEAAVNSEMMEDERDKLIELKSLRVVTIISGIGFIAGVVMLVLDYSAVYLLNIMFGACFLGTIGQEITKLVYYKVR